MQKKQILESIYQNFQDITGYKMVVGVEQEFYIIPAEGFDIPGDMVTTELNKILSKYPFFSRIEKEKGQGQFEVQISPTDNPVVMSDIIMLLRRIISCEIPSLPLEDGTAQPQATSSFSAKPYPDQPGSGMHININLVDNYGNNVFTRSGEEESILLEQSIAGLLELMPASMKYFSPYDSAYIRYKEHGMESPSTYSWGADNRTVALRIPSVPLNPYARRIEHRVSCADADPYVTIAAIIAGAQYGLENKLENKHPKIWGNAFLPQYSLPVLPHSLEEAEAIRHRYLDNILNLFG